ncbi:MAG: hypothetical protein ACHQ9S_11475 [Candidatus Binatia bacterium]
MKRSARPAWCRALPRSAALLSGVILVLAPAAARACPMCYESSRPGVLSAYYLSTALLTLLPFAIFGAVAFVAFRIAHRAREQERDMEVPAEPTA